MLAVANGLKTKKTNERLSFGIKRDKDVVLFVLILKLLLSTLAGRFKNI